MAAARHRDDEAAVAALLYGGCGPVDQQGLLETALDIIAALASAQGAEELPSVDGEVVLQRWLLEMAG